MISVSGHNYSSMAMTGASVQPDTRWIRPSNVCHLGKGLMQLKMMWLRYAN